MFSILSDKISNTFVNNKKITEDKKEIFAYGINRILCNFTMITVSAVIGAISGNLINVLLFLLLFIPIRKYCGGFHLELPINCFIASIFTVIIAILISAIIRDSEIKEGISVALSIFSIIIIFLLAPVESLNKQLTLNEKKVYKNKAIKILLLYCLVFSISIICKAEQIYAIITVAFLIEVLLLFLGKLKNNRIMKKQSLEC